jgi:uncharacterized membrane-anchored protein YjiN (DUF445 family)
MISNADVLASTARAVRKQSQLARMQRLATGLLCVALGVLLLSARYESVWPWLRWVRAFAEASAIGAIADWYAVVALFRRPLGLPIPHTAIIPSSKDSIGKSLGEFVTQYLLTPENVVGKLERYDSARHVAGWAAVPANASRLAALLMSAVPGLLRAPDDADIRRLFRLHVAPKLLELNMAQPLSKALEALIGAGLHRMALEAGLRFVDRWLVSNEELIRSKFAQASKYTPAPLDAYIVRKFLQGFRALVHEISTEPAHALRAQVDEALRALVGELEESPRYRQMLRDWLRELLEQWARDEDIHQLRETLAARVEADLLNEDSALRQSAAALIIALAEGVGRDRGVLDRINGAWLRFARSLTVQFRGQISTLIAEVLKSWDAEEVSRKVQLEIGKDLQFIRINGALVGGVVGVALHACTLFAA